MMSPIVLLYGRWIYAFSSSRTRPERPGLVGSAHVAPICARRRIAQHVLFCIESPDDELGKLLTVLAAEPGRIAIISGAPDTCGA